MTVYLLWTSATGELDGEGPWRCVHRATEGLWFVESDEPLSRIYHEAKWSLPEDSALLVTRADVRPKLKGLSAGSTTWLRDRLPLPRHR